MQGAVLSVEPSTASQKYKRTPRAQLRQRIYESLTSATAWEHHISEALGNRYWLVKSKHMFQTRLLVYARVDVVPQISDVTSGFEATGVGRVGLNKGGVAVGLKVGETDLAFVGCHLAAHQSKVLARHQDVRWV